jgi:uncharacterized Tic20 family protein
MARNEDDGLDDEGGDDDDRDAPRNEQRPEPSKDDMQMAMFCHLGGILGIILPLVLWLTQREKSWFIDDQGKEAVNFGITMMIAHVGFGLITCGFGVFITWPLALVFHILAGMAAGRGECYRYPICFRFVT